MSADAVRGCREGAKRATGAGADARQAVVWHDLECGSYEADLPLWRELAAFAAGAAAPAAGRILDVGAGTGRVTLDLVAHGHDVTALERHPALLAALRDRWADAAPRAGARAGRVATVCADARRLGDDGWGALPRDVRFALVIVAMQTLQLFGGARGREAFLRGAHARLAAGGVVACAIVADLDAFDVAAGDPRPPAERAHVHGLDYTSRAVRVAVDAGTITIEREREVCAPAGLLAREATVTTLDRLDPAQLAAEAAAAGLRPLGMRAVPDTSEHVGSTVVMLGG